MTYRQSGTFDNPGVPTDWLEFTFFNTVSDQGTPATLATDFYIRRLEITGAATSKPGDFDSDGDVDGADLVAGQVAEFRNSADLAQWRTNFGAAASAAAGTAVPEPSAVACGYRTHRSSAAAS